MTEDDLDQDLADARRMLPVEQPSAEPDWNALHASIAAAIAREPARGGWKKPLLVGGGLAVIAAVALIALWPARRGAPAVVEAPLTEEELAAEVAVTPDDLGGITVDEDLIDEAAALDDDPDEDPELEPLLPDSAWLDDFSDEELDRAAEWLAKEAG